MFILGVREEDDGVSFAQISSWSTGKMPVIRCISTLTGRYTGRVRRYRLKAFFVKIKAEF